MQDPLNVDDLFKCGPLFLGFDDNDAALLTRDSHAVCVSRHDFAFRRDDHADGFYVVVVDTIKLILPKAHGQCKVIEFFGPNECFDGPFIFPSHPYTTDVQAMEDSLLIWVGKRAVDDALHVHPRLVRQMLTGLSTRLHTLMCDIETVNLQSANERLIGYLPSLPRKFDRTRFPCSKSLAASKLGLAPTTLSHTSRQLIRDGLIHVEDHEVVIQSTTALQCQLMAG